MGVAREIFFELQKIAAASLQSLKTGGSTAQLCDDSRVEEKALSAVQLWPVCALSRYRRLDIRDSRGYPGKYVGQIK